MARDGHLGLPAILERAAALGGTLALETGLPGRWHAHGADRASGLPRRPRSRCGETAGGYSQRIDCGASRIRTIRAGAPAATALAGMSRVTTEAVPMMLLSPTRAPRRIELA